MKLRYDDKQQIYELRKNGVSYSQLSQLYDIQISNLKYMPKLMDRYGVEVAKKGKNPYYSTTLKQEMIDKVLISGCSQNQVLLDYALPSPSMLSNWIVQYKYDSWESKRETAIMGRKKQKTWEEMTELERLKEENERLRTEVAYLKKLRELRLRDEALTRERQKQLEKWSMEDFD